MTIRITGMNSGLDTESIINELASARSMKVQKVEKEQTKLSWKIDAWKALNTKIYSLYTDVLSDMRFDYAYSKKTTKVSNPNAVSVVTGSDAINGAQSMKISQLAKASYLTGGAIKEKAASMTGDKIGKTVDYVAGTTPIARPTTEDWTMGNKISSTAVGAGGTFNVTVGGVTKSIDIFGSYTLEDVATEIFNQTGVVALLDEGSFVFMSDDIQFSAAEGDDKEASAALLKNLGLDIGEVQGNTTLTALGVGAGTINLTVDDDEKEVVLDGNMTLDAVAAKIRETGLDARFDAESGKFVISATEPGKSFRVSMGEGSGALAEKLGLVGAGVSQNADVAGTTKLLELGLAADDSMTLNVKIGDTTTSITLYASDKLEDVATKFKEAGLDARFDSAAGQFILSAKELGKDFTISTTEGDTVSASMLERMGLKRASEGVAHVGKVGDGSTKLKDLGFGTDSKEIKFKLIVAGKEEEITLKGSQTLDDVATMLRDKGLNAKFDAGTKRFFISSKETGDANKFSIEADNEEAKTALKNLGLYYNPADPTSTGKMIEAQDAKVELNGVEFTFAKNTFEVNGLTITAMQTTKEGEEITLTTQQDTDGIYDMIKNFVKKYNELINEMDKLYNAKSSSKYEPLTKEEKDAMSDTEVEEWEKTIKESLLRRDMTLSSVASAMKNVMTSTRLEGKVGINNGKDIYLSFFGIETLGYYKSKDNEKNAYHINGDKDDTNVRNNEDKLKKAIANDPDTVIEFFKSLANNLYTTLDEKMARVEGYSSAFTVYNDLQMKEDLKKYDSKVKTEQKKLNDYVDRWYRKFSQMEVAMAKMKSKESSLSGLFGG